MEEKSELQESGNRFFFQRLDRVCKRIKKKLLHCVSCALAERALGKNK